MQDARTVNNPSAGEQKSRLIWGGLIVSLLGMQIFCCLLAWFFATNVSLAVVPNYHQKALDWDQQQAAQRASDALGWQCEVTVGAAEDLYQNRTITLKLADADGEPIELSEISATAFHLAKPGEVYQLPFLLTKPGLYTTSLRMTDEGFWQFELDGRRSDDRLITSHIVDVQEAPQIGRAIR